MDDVTKIKLWEQLQRTVAPLGLEITRGEQTFLLLKKEGSYLLYKCDTLEGLALVLQGYLVRLKEEEKEQFKEVFTVARFMALLVEDAKAYRADATASILRNKHLNDHKGRVPSQGTIDTVLVDFLNYFAHDRYAMDCDFRLTHLLCEDPWGPLVVKDGQ